MQTVTEAFRMASPLDEVTNPPSSQESQKGQDLWRRAFPPHCPDWCFYKPTKKVRLLVEMLAIMAAGGGITLNKDFAQTQPCKDYVIKYANKVSKCVKLHFNAIVDAFIVRHPRFQHTTFKCTWGGWSPAFPCLSANVNTKYASLCYCGLFLFTLSPSHQI